MALAEAGVCRAVLRKYIRIRFPVFRCKVGPVYRIRNPGFGLFHGRARSPVHGSGHDSVRRNFRIHRTCFRRNFRRRTSTKAVKSRSNCSYFQLLSAIDYVGKQFLDKKGINCYIADKRQGRFHQVDYALLL